MAEPAMKPKPDVFDVLRDADRARQVDLWYRSLPPGLFTHEELIEQLDPIPQAAVDAAALQIEQELEAKGMSRAAIAAAWRRLQHEIDAVKSRHVNDRGWQ